MQPVETADPTFRFSTRELLPAERLPALRDVFGEMIQFDLDADADRPVLADITVQAMPGYRQTHVQSMMSARIERRPDRVADGNDTVCMILKSAGRIALTQRGQEAEPMDGEGIVLMYRDAADLRFFDATYLAVRVPFSELAPLAFDVESATARRIPSDTDSLRLLRSYLMHLPAGISDPRLERLSARHVYDLMAMAIGATNEAAHSARAGGVRSARLAVAKAELARDPGLSVETVARSQNVTARYIQMLFEEDGTTFSDFRLETRLSTARDLLLSPRYAHYTITEIALEAGFGDLSYFNRRFRLRFGLTPSELRLEAQDQIQKCPTALPGAADVSSRPKT